MALSLDIAANTRQAQSQVKDLGEALEDVADSLDEVASEGKDSGDKLERSFRDMARAAEKAGDDVGDGMKKGFKRAEQGADEFKSEANSTAKESAASFDGSAESIGDAFQEVAANAFAGFGPAGAVAGIAAAAGIGLAISGFEAIADAQEASEEEIGKWADTYIEAGGRVLTASQIAASAQAIVTDPEKWKTAQKNAELWGVSVETAVLAAAGNAPSLDAVNGSLDRQRDAFTEATAAGDLNAEQRDKELSRLGEATSAYNTLTDGMTKGRAAANVYSQSLLDLIGTTEDASMQTDELGNAVYTLPGGKQILVDAQTGEASENLDGFKGDLETVPSTVATTVKVTVDSSAWDRWTPNPKTGRVGASAPGRYWE